MGRVGFLSLKDFFGRSGRGVIVSRQPRQNPMKLHRHEFFEVVLVLSGEGIHNAKGFRHRIGKGDVLFLDPRSSHGYEETEDLSLLNILIRDDALARIGRELGDLPGYHVLFGLQPDPKEAGFRRRLRLSAEEAEQIDDWAGRIEEAVPSHGAARLIETAYLTLIVDVLSRKYGRERGKAPRPASPERTRLRMGRLLGWIDSHLASPCAVGQMAERIGMSESTFHRAFRAATGLSPHAYLLRARLTRAARLLAEPEWAGETIAAVAAACGFGDSNHFSRAFGRFAGCSPRAWRKRAVGTQGQSVGKILPLRRAFAGTKSSQASVRKGAAGRPSAL
ncbi:MAG TPA: helix-turn-helix domain-containing protein [Candidatus Methylacidiphilales bacterium]